MRLINRFNQTYENFIKQLGYESTLNKNVEDLYSAIIYQLEIPGKQLRPKLMLLIAEDLNIDYADVETFALALELIHNYSLIHDDLPAMDDDDYRRGRLTIHKKYSEATAILAGDYLLNKSFELLSSLSLDDQNKQLSAIAYLASKSCDFGMLGGQIIDMNPDNIKNIDDLFKMYEYKTGSLFKISFVIPGILSNTKKINIDELEELGRLFGLYFQIKDDFADREEDMKINKKTIFSFKSTSQAEAIMKDYLEHLLEKCKEAELYNTLKFIEDLV